MRRQLAFSRIIQLFAYLLVFSLTWWVTAANFPENTFVRMGFLFLYPAVGIFLFSVVLNNSSMFDPYWSVMPVFLLLFFFFHPEGHWHLVSGEVASPGMTFVRPVVVFLLVLAWGTRLTWNFFRGWKGLSHEDWRYADFRKKTGKTYWLVSLTAIHLFPALMVFMGSLSLWVVFYRRFTPFNMLDVLAILVTAGAILLEARADRQLHRHLQQPHDPAKIFRKGLWAVSRHPNYLGEISFWWGLFLFALASDAGSWWVVAGPAAMTCMFLFASIPLIEKRMMERRKDYGEYRKEVSMILPVPKKKI